ncbi:MAG: hypothetical protein HRU16_04080 [Planctomycetes bacterium]|nr:hypothetical protein [Planctomycetota bacterium]
MSGLSKNRFSVPTTIVALVLGLLLLSTVIGCGTTPTSPDSTTSASSSAIEVGDERYTRILQQGEIVGYIGKKVVTVVAGGTTTTSEQFNVYDSGFQILGTYDEAGATYRFTRGNTKKLGNFSPEHSIRQITGIEGIIELKEGLQ